MTYRLDFRTLIFDLGGHKVVARRLTEMGLPVEASTVYQWTVRQSFNAIYLANLLAHSALVDNKPIDLLRYLRPASDGGRFRPRAAPRASHRVPAP